MKVSECYYFRKISAHLWFKDIEKINFSLIWLTWLYLTLLFSWCHHLTNSERSGSISGLTLWLLLLSWLQFHKRNQFFEQFCCSHLSYIDMSHSHHSTIVSRARSRTAGDSEAGYCRVVGGPLAAQRLMNRAFLKIFLSLFFFQINLKSIINLFKNFTLKLLSLSNVVYKEIYFFSTSFVTTMFAIRVTYTKPNYCSYGISCFFCTVKSLPFSHIC